MTNTMAHPHAQFNRAPVDHLITIMVATCDDGDVEQVVGTRGGIALGKNFKPKGSQLTRRGRSLYVENLFDVSHVPPEPSMPYSPPK